MVARADRRQAQAGGIGAYDQSRVDLPIHLSPERPAPEQIELTFFRAHSCDVYMKIAEGVFLERLLGLGASGFRQAGDTTCWMCRHSSIFVSTIPNSLLTNRTTSTASRTFGTRRSVICGNSTVFPKSISGYF
jgi:hypothetical protein